MSGGLVPSLNLGIYETLSGIGDELKKQRQAEEVAKFYQGQLGPLTGAAPAAGGTFAALSGAGAPAPAAQPGKLPSFAGGAQTMALPTGTNPEIESKFVGALKAGGLTNPFGLAAFAAYANRESGYSPKNITGSWSDPSQSGQAGTSGGILSWRNERLANMRRQTAGAADPVVAQAQFALTENPQVTMALQNAKSPEEANSILANAWRFAGFDQPGGENAARLNATRAYVAKLGGGQTAPAQGQTQVASADMPAAGARPVGGGYAVPGQSDGFEPGSQASPAIANGRPGSANIVATGAGRLSPQQAQQLRGMLASGNPQLQAAAISTIQKLQQPTEWETKEIGGRGVQVNKNGDVRAIPGLDKPKSFQAVKGDDGNTYLLDPETGQMTRALQGKDGTIRSLTPAEKEALGIDPKAFAQMDADGKVTFPGKANTEVNLSQGVEKAYDADIGKANAAAFNETQKAERDAIGQRSTLGVMRRLIENPNFYSGTGGELSTAAKRAFASLGLTEADSAAPQELFAKLSKQFVLDKAGGSLGGGFSNGDRDFISATTANPNNTPEGNKLIVEMATRSAQRQIDIAKMARKYAAAHGGRLDSGFNDEVNAYAEANPVFAGLKLPGEGGQKSPPPPPGGKTNPPAQSIPLKPSLPQGYSQEDALDQARSAISAGKDPALIRRQLETWGVNPGLL